MSEMIFSPSTCNQANIGSECSYLLVRCIDYRTTNLRRSRTQQCTANATIQVGTVISICQRRQLTAVLISAAEPFSVSLIFKRQCKRQSSPGAIGTSIWKRKNFAQIRQQVRTS